MQEQPIGFVTVPTIDTGGYFNSIVDFFVSQTPTAFDWAKHVIGWLVGLAIPISFIFFIGIIYSVERLKIIRKKEEKEKYGKPEESKIEKAEEIKGGTGPTMLSESKADIEMQKKWSRIIQHVESVNPNDWRQAVIEADILLGDLLVKLGYKGMSIGEQLNRVELGDFKHRQEAWDAHKVRNEIAHSGSDFAFSQHDARQTIHKYKRVFEEFYSI